MHRQLLPREGASYLVAIADVKRIAFHARSYFGGEQLERDAEPAAMGRSIGRGGLLYA
jgi:hypothetical protein